MVLKQNKSSDFSIEIANKEEMSAGKKYERFRII
jgi:hypothetical protein